MHNLSHFKIIVIAEIKFYVKYEVHSKTIVLLISLVLIATKKCIYCFLISIFTFIYVSQLLGMFNYFKNIGIGVFQFHLYTLPHHAE